MSFLKRYLEKVKNKNEKSSAVAFYAALDHLEESCGDLKITDAIMQELRDQRSSFKLIASENYSSLAVQQAMGNLLTDKYSEGIPNKRFYAGCGNIDKIEIAAIEGAKKIFNCDHAYVQPHSGADANLVAFWSVIIQKVQGKELEKFGGRTLDELSDKEYEEVRKILTNQKIMGMALNAGGHLTHGYRHNISSKMMRASSYGVDINTGLLDYADIKKRVMQEKPLILIAGYSAYPRLVNFAKMKEIAEMAGSVLMVDMAHFAGLVAGKVLKGEYNPVPYADIITSTTHKTLRGPRGGLVLCKKEFKDTVDKGCPLVLGGPLPHVMAAKAVAFKEADSPEFCAYAAKVVENARVLAESFKKLGVKVVTGGTDNHMLLLDVYSSFGLTGRQAESAMREAGFTCNRNAIINDVNGPWYTSGVRLGSPAVTTRGMGEKEMERTAAIIFNVLKNTKPAVSVGGKISKAKTETDPAVLKKAKTEAKELLCAFPLYPELALD